MRHDECPMAIALKEDHSVRGYEAMAERPDGSMVSFIPYPTPLHDPEGRLIGAVNVLVDVTDRKLAEERRDASDDALRLSNAVKDEFLGLVSHELRTPVTTIFGNARLLQDRGDRLAEVQRRTMVDDIATDADRLLGVVENLLLLTRLESGTRPDLEPQVIDHVVRRAVQSFRRRHPARTIRLHVQMPHVIVDADRTYLDVLVENLLSNADKYSPPEAPIRVNVRGVDGEVEVIVHDRGIGIRDSDAKALFEPFYRAAPAKARAAGVGVGLAVCKKVIDVQGGRIWARSRPRGGAEFGFALPIGAHAAISAQGRARPSDPS
jgi:K+-sensing histidine kinase KdpD